MSCVIRPPVCVADKLICHRTVAVFHTLPGSTGHSESLIFMQAPGVELAVSSVKFWMLVKGDSLQDTFGSTVLTFQNAEARIFARYVEH